MYSPLTTSGALTASAQIDAGTGFVFGYDLLPPGSGSAILKLYDGPSATGRLISTVEAAAGGKSAHVDFSQARPFKNGLYAELSFSKSGQTTTYVVAFYP